MNKKNIFKKSITFILAIIFMFAISNPVVGCSISSFNSRVPSEMFRVERVEYKFDNGQTVTLLPNSSVATAEALLFRGLFFYFSDGIMLEFAPGSPIGISPFTMYGSYIVAEAAINTLQIADGEIFSFCIRFEGGNVVVRAEGEVLVGWRDVLGFNVTMYFMPYMYSGEYVSSEFLKAKKNSRLMRLPCNYFRSYKVRIPELGVSSIINRNTMPRPPDAYLEFYGDYIKTVTSIPNNFTSPNLFSRSIEKIPFRQEGSFFHLDIENSFVDVFRRNNYFTPPTFDVLNILNLTQITDLVEDAVIFAYKYNNFVVAAMQFNDITILNYFRQACKFYRNTAYGQCGCSLGVQPIIVDDPYGLTRFNLGTFYQLEFDSFSDSIVALRYKSVDIYNTNFNHLYRIELESLSNRISVYDGRLFIALANPNRIEVFDLSNFAYKNTIEVQVIISDFVVDGNILTYIGFRQRQHREVLLMVNLENNRYFDELNNRGLLGDEHSSTFKGRLTLNRNQNIIYVSMANRIFYICSKTGEILHDYIVFPTRDVVLSGQGERALFDGEFVHFYDRVFLEDSVEIISYNRLSRNYSPHPYFVPFQTILVTDTVDIVQGKNELMAIYDRELGEFVEVFSFVSGPIVVLLSPSTTDPSLSAFNPRWWRGKINSVGAISLDENRFMLIDRNMRQVAIMEL